MITLYTPVTLHEIGQRSNNEDALFPVLPSENDSLFIVCDGVGGHAKGEIASQMICTIFPRYFPKKFNTPIASQDFLYAMNKVDDAMAAYIKKNPAANGMASTFTAVAIDRKRQQIQIAWVGDSRVYHIRNGQICYVTKDHSFVQDLIDNGEINAVEAKSHPKRNVIMRSVNGLSPSRMDIEQIDNIQENDFFLLCTDGILENLGIDEIQSYFSASKTPAEIQQLIRDNAGNRTNDNYTMLLIKVKEVSEISQPVVKESRTKGKPKKTLLNIFYFVLLISLLWLLWQLV